MQFLKRLGENRTAIHANLFRRWGLSGVKGRTEVRDEIWSPVRLYFDTNIFSYIYRLKETESVRQLLRTHKLKLCVSNCHMLETMQIRDTAKRKRRLAQLRRLAPPEHNLLPRATFLQAVELREAIGLYHPDWLVEEPDERFVKKALSDDLFLWNRAQYRPDIAGRFFQLAYKSTSDEGWRVSRPARLDLRSQKTKGGLELRLENAEKSVVIGNPHSEPDLYWRVSGASNWWAALINDIPHLRDYSDFLEPYVQTHRMTETAFIALWLRVEGGAMPRNRLAGLAEFFSLDTRVNHGDNMDAIHATYLPDVDWFLTGDKGFHQSALQMRQGLGDDGPPYIGLIDVSLDSFTSQLRTLLSL